MTSAANVVNIYAEELARAEQEAAGYREVAQAALDQLHTAYLEELNTYETLERYRAEKPGAASRERAP